MMLTSQQVADLLNHHLNITSVTAAKVWVLVKAGALTDVGPGRSIRIDSHELNRFLASLRFVTRSQWPTSAPIYRVSLLEAGLGSPRTNKAGVTFAWSGADLSGKIIPSEAERLAAFEGVWLASEATAQEAVDQKALLVGTVKGYVHPSYVREIIAYERNTEYGLRTWFHTRPAPKKVLKWLGAGGAWINVMPGRSSDWL